MRSLEILSDGLLEDDFLKIFKPFYYVQTVLGSARINFKNKSVTPPTLCQKIYGFSLVLYNCIICYNLQGIRIFISKVDKKSDLQIILYLGLLCSSISVVFCTIIVNNFVYTEKNRKIFLFLQFLDRNLKFVGKEKRYERLHKFSLYACIFTVGTHTLLSLTPFIFFYNESFIKYLIVIPMLLEFVTDDFEILLFLCFIYFLVGRVRYINQVIVEHTSLYRNGNYSKSTDESDTFRRMFVAYKCVVNAFRIIEETFSPLLLFISFQAFCNLLMAVEEYIAGGKDIKWYIFLQLNGLVIKLVVRLIILGTSVNYLYIAVDETKQRCIRALQTYPNGHTRRGFKNIIRVISVQMKPLSVFNMFELHRLPIGLMSLTATYTVVLLQFAFL